MYSVNMAVRRFRFTQRVEKVRDLMEIIDTTNAAEFWDKLSPEKPLFSRPCKLLYRGQAHDDWRLIPSILRRGISETSDMQVFKEWAYIETFARHCDSIGLTIPNDAPAFREKFLNQNSLFAPGMGIADWPPPDMHPLLALAQHYRLCSRQYKRLGKSPLRLIMPTANGRVFSYHSGVERERQAGSAPAALPTGRLLIASGKWRAHGPYGLQPRNHRYGCLRVGLWGELRRKHLPSDAPRKVHYTFY